MADKNYCDQFTRKTLVLEWETHHEWRVVIGDLGGNISHSLHQAINQSGITNGQPGIIPDSIRVRVED